MNELLEAAKQLQDVVLAEGWKFCFIGGLALQRWGEPRFTRDVDITLLTGFGNEETYVDRLLELFPARIKSAREFALMNRVMLLTSREGVGLDIAMGALPFEESAVSRATYFEYASDAYLLTCSAEDLVIMKAFASRSQDWVDVEGIMIRQQGKLDKTYITQHLRTLCEVKEDLTILSRLEELFERHSC